MNRLASSPNENQILAATSFEEISLPSGQKIQIPKCNLVFEEWKGEPIKDTYNNKAVVDFDGEPLFAELAILRMFQKEGWNGVWVDSYRNKYHVALPEKENPVQLPSEQQKLIDSIKERTGKRGGCWDVFAWRNREYKFVESKRIGKDALRPNQTLWLEKSLELGLKINDFLLAEWDLA